MKMGSRLISSPGLRRGFRSLLYLIFCRIALKSREINLGGIFSRQDFGFAG